MSKELIMEGIDLPVDEERIEYARKTIEKFKKRVLYHKSIRALSKDEYIILHKLIVQALEYVADLSLPAFGIQEEIETRYYRMYRHAPELAKKLFLDHYNEIHKPYNTLKNRCFTLLEDIDEIYFKINHVRPPQEY